MEKEKFEKFKDIGIDVADTVKSLGVGFVVETALMTLLWPVWKGKTYMKVLGSIGVTALSGAAMSACHKDHETVGDAAGAINDIVNDLKSEPEPEPVTE